MSNLIPVLDMAPDQPIKSLTVCCKRGNWYFGARESCRSNQMPRSLIPSQAPNTVTVLGKVSILVWNVPSPFRVKYTNMQMSAKTLFTDYGKSRNWKRTHSMQTRILDLFWLTGETMENKQSPDNLILQRNWLYLFLSCNVNAQKTSFSFPCGKVK